MEYVLYIRFMKVFDAKEDINQMVVKSCLYSNIKKVYELAYLPWCKRYGNEVKSYAHVAGCFKTTGCFVVSVGDLQQSFRLIVNKRDVL